MERQNQKVYHVWVGEEDRIASFYEVTGYHLEKFENHEFFIKYLRQLQEQGFRFQ